jgi:hypothetical protein
MEVNLHRMGIIPEFHIYRVEVNEREEDKAEDADWEKMLSLMFSQYCHCIWPISHSEQYYRYMNVCFEITEGK